MSKKIVKRSIGFVNYYRNYIPRLSGKLLGFYELLKADKQIKVTEDLLDNYKAINAAIAEANITAQLLLRMWASHTSPKINPRTSHIRTTGSDTRTDGKTPRNHKNDSGMQIKLLLSWISTKNQTIGTELQRLHQI